MVPETVRLERAAMCGCGELVPTGERPGYAAELESVVCLNCLPDVSAEPAHDVAAPRVDVELPTRWTADAAVIATTLDALRGVSHEPAPGVVHAVDSHEPAPDVAHAVGSHESRHGAEAVEDQGMPSAALRRRAGLFTRLLTVRSFRGQPGWPRATRKPDAVVGDILHAASVQGVLTLHDRRIPGRRGHIEHIAVGASGVHVIDVLHFKNASIEVRRGGDAPADSDTLVVGGRVMTSAVVATGGRVAALRSLLAAAGLDDVPVSGSVCFIEGLLPLSVADLEVRGIHVMRPSGLTAHVATPGALPFEDRVTLHRLLAQELPASA